MKTENASLTLDNFNLSSQQLVPNYFLYPSKVLMSISKRLILAQFTPSKHFSATRRHLAIVETRPKSGKRWTAENYWRSIVMFLTLNRLHFSWSYGLPKILLLPYTCNGIKYAVLTAPTKMIGHHTRFRENGDLLPWRGSAEKKKPPFFNARALMTREVMCSRHALPILGNDLNSLIPLATQFNSVLALWSVQSKKWKNQHCLFGGGRENFSKTISLIKLTTKNSWYFWSAVLVWYCILSVLCHCTSMFQHGGPWNGHFGLFINIFLPFVFLLIFSFFSSISWLGLYLISSRRFCFPAWFAQHKSLSANMFSQSQEPSSVSAPTIKCWPPPCPPRELVKMGMHWFEPSQKLWPIPDRLFSLWFREMTKVWSPAVLLWAQVQWLSLGRLCRHKPLWV